MTKVFSTSNDHNSSSPFRSYLSRHWEEIFFLLLYSLLILQVLFFITDTKSILGNNGGVVAAFVAFESFVLTIASYTAVPLLIVPLVCLVVSHGRPAWARTYLDSIGTYFAARMFIQLVGLNLLVFDRESPRFSLITQLLFFLPYSLLIWGWIYWRLDNYASAVNHRYFKLDCEWDNPRPIDYLVASFSSVFSASISSIKGRSARARILIIVHGFVVYDIMGLTLSRAVALIQLK
jgi:hypothetical protein